MFCVRSNIVCALKEPHIAWSKLHESGSHVCLVCSVSSVVGKCSAHSRWHNKYLMHEGRNKQMIKQQITVSIKYFWKPCLSVSHSLDFKLFQIVLAWKILIALTLTCEIFWKHLEIFLRTKKQIPEAWVWVPFLIFSGWETLNRSPSIFETHFSICKIGIISVQPTSYGSNVY